MRNSDGGVLYWKPGENCQIRVPVWLKEEKAIAEGVLVRDAWDGSIQDIELEVTGFQRQEFTEEEERAAVQSAVGGIGSSHNSQGLRPRSNKQRILHPRSSVAMLC